jgi:estrone sulfotransferase
LKPPKAESFRRRIERIGVRDDDVFIVSYPRSGNTWMRFFLANLLAPRETITFRNIENFVPDLHKSASGIPDCCGHRYIKSHYPSYDCYPRFIYLYRDGRDAVVSYYHYVSGRKAFTGNFDEFLFSPHASKFGSWREHVTAALDFAASFPERVLVLRYETMREKTDDFAAKAASFAGIEFDQHDLAAAIAKSSFDQLKSIEKKFGGEETQDQGAFFRRGETGQWRHYFTDALYERYLRDNRQTLLRLGYSV